MAAHSTHDEPDAVDRDLAIDTHRAAGTARTDHRRMSTRSTRPPERDPLLATVGSLRDLVQHYARTSTWRLTLASASACASFQVPLRTDNLLTRGLFFLAAVGVGALAGRWLDRKRNRPLSSPASTKSASRCRRPAPAGVRPGRGPRARRHASRRCRGTAHRIRNRHRPRSTDS
jgi:hypothetical protein